MLIKLSTWSFFEIGMHSQGMKTDNSFFERVEEFKYLRTALTNQNSVREEIKSD